VEPRQRFEELYRAYADNVHAYALRRTTPAAADDVVADVFLVAWRRLSAVPSDPYPWLLGVARRVLANRRRGEGRASALRLKLAEAAPTPAELVSGTGMDARVVRALHALSEGDRELLTLIAWDGLDHSELAAALGIRRGAVAVRLHRARARFADALAAADDNDVLVEVRR
jgi:RNA polymerase sigma-70 factor (ECF subfamily)